MTETPEETEAQVAPEEPQDEAQEAAEEQPEPDALAQPHHDRVEAYKDEGGKWRWRKKAGNGATIASSGESFSSRQHAERAAQRANPGVTMRTTLDEE